MTMGSPAVIPSSRKTQSSIRRTNKPLVEKKRRARINGCLGQLKSLLLSAMKSEGTQVSRLEKADILEMTVKYLRHIQCQQTTALGIPTTQEPDVAAKFSAGYSECASEVIRYMESVSGMTPDIKSRLEHHLVGRLHGSVSSTTSSTPSSSSPSSLPSSSSSSSSSQMSNSNTRTSSYHNHSQQDNPSVGGSGAGDGTASHRVTSSSGHEEMSVHYQTAIDLANMASEIVCKQDTTRDNYNDLEHPSVIQRQSQNQEDAVNYCTNNVIQRQSQNQEDAVNYCTNNAPTYTQPRNYSPNTRSSSEDSFSYSSDDQSETQSTLYHASTNKVLNWDAPLRKHCDDNAFQDSHLGYAGRGSAPTPPDTPPNTPPHSDEEQKDGSSRLHDSYDSCDDDLQSPTKLVVVDDSDSSPQISPMIVDEDNHSININSAGRVRSGSIANNSFESYANRIKNSPGSNNCYEERMRNDFAVLRNNNNNNRTARGINFSNCLQPLSSYQTPLHIDIPETPSPSTSPSPPFLLPAQPIHPSSSSSSSSTTTQKFQTEESLPTIPYGVHHPVTSLHNHSQQITTPSSGSNQSYNPSCPNQQPQHKVMDTTGTTCNLDNCPNTNSRQPIELVSSEFPWSKQQKQTQIHLFQQGRPHPHQPAPSPSPPTLTREDLPPAPPSHQVKATKHMSGRSLPHVHINRVAGSPTTASDKETAPSSTNDNRLPTSASLAREQAHFPSPPRVNACLPVEMNGPGRGHESLPTINSSPHKKYDVTHCQQYQTSSNKTQILRNCEQSQSFSGVCSDNANMSRVNLGPGCRPEAMEKKVRFQISSHVTTPTPTQSSMHSNSYNLNYNRVPPSSSLSSSSSSTHFPHQSSYQGSTTSTPVIQIHANTNMNGQRLKNPQPSQSNNVTRQNCPPLSPLTLRRVMMGQGLRVNSRPDCTEARRVDPLSTAFRGYDNDWAKGHNPNKLCRVPLVVYNGSAARFPHQSNLLEDRLWRPW